jgi:hypothetical protein
MMHSHLEAALEALTQAEAVALRMVPEVLE